MFGPMFLTPKRSGRLTQLPCMILSLQFQVYVVLIPVGNSHGVNREVANFFGSFNEQ